MLQALVLEYREIFDAFVVPRLHPRDIARASMTCRGLRAVSVCDVCVWARRISSTLKTIRAITYRILRHTIHDERYVNSIRIEGTSVRDMPSGACTMHVYGKDDQGEFVNVWRYVREFMFEGVRLYGDKSWSYKNRVYRDLATRSPRKTWIARRQDLYCIANCTNICDRIVVKLTNRDIAMLTMTAHRYRVFEWYLTRASARS